MIADQGLRQQVGSVNQKRRFRVIASGWPALGGCDEHGTDGVLSWIATGIGIDVKKVSQCDVEPRFFLCFANGGVFG